MKTVSMKKEIAERYKLYATVSISLCTCILLSCGVNLIFFLNNKFENKYGTDAEWRFRRDHDRTSLCETLWDDQKGHSDIILHLGEYSLNDGSPDLF